MTSVVVMLAEELEAHIRKATADGVAAGIAHAKVDAAQSAYMSPTKYAVHRGVSRATVHRWLRDGMPCIGRGKSRRIGDTAAERWLRDQATQAAEQSEKDDAASVAARKLARGR